MGNNVNTKWLQRAYATGEVTRQCAVPTELTIPFSFCKKALSQWDTCTIALTAAQRQTWVNYPSRQLYSPLHKNCVHKSSINPLRMDTVMCSDKYISIMHIPSFHWHVQNATIPCRFQELLPFLSVMHFFLPPFSTNYSFILSHLILPSISWPTSQSCCSQIHI